MLPSSVGVGGGAMPQQSVTIVGAGLAGLTAAINLARDGYDVTILEKEKRHGGRPEFRPDGAASPFDFRALGRAYEEFKQLTAFFRRSMLFKRTADRMPLPLRRVFWGAAAAGLTKASPETSNRMMRFVPGFGRLPG